MLTNRKFQIYAKKLKAITAPGASPSAASYWSRPLVGGILIGAWLLVLLGVPVYLPVQLASWLTFIGLLIAPGYFVGDMIAHTLRLDWLERMAVAFPLGVATLSLSGMVALLGHLTVADLAAGWVLTTSIVIVAWLAYSLWMARRRLPPQQQEPWTIDEVVMLLLLGAAFVLVLPLLNLNKIDGDAYAVGSFAADALSGIPLNVTEPLFGTELGPGVRMAFNQSLPMSYLWSYYSGVSPLTLTAMASRAMIALWALLAAYTLGKAAGAAMPGQGSGRRLGLFTTVVLMLVYLSNPFFRGDSVSYFFFERTTADKFMVPITMLPIVFAFVIRFLSKGKYGAWFLAAIVTFAVSAIHPLIAAMLALALAAFGAFHWLLNIGSKQVLRRAAVLSVLIGIAMFLPMVQLVLSRSEAPLAASFPSTIEGWPVGHKLVPALPFVHAQTLDIYGPLPDLSQLNASEASTTNDPFLIWRFAVNMNRRRLILFDLDHYISDPNIVLELPYLLALLLLPLLFRGIRKSIGAQFAVSTSLAILFVMFNPILTPLIGSFVMPWILWRFVWMLPYALIIAMAITMLLPIATRTLARLVSKEPNKQVQRERVFGVYGLLAFVVATTLVLSPGIAANMQNLNERAGFPYYYPTPERLLGTLDRLTAGPNAATVLADQDLSVSIPAYAANAHIVAHRVPTTSEIFPADRQAEALQRLIDQDAFFRSRYLTAEAVDILRRYDVGYVITPSGSNLDIQLRLAPEWFEWLLDDQSYSLYQVHSLPTVTPSVEGNTALADRQWAAAERYYQQTLDESPGNMLALAGMAEIAHAQGQFADALSFYTRALAEEDLAVLHYRLGQLYAEMGQTERSIEEFGLAQQVAPNVTRFHVAMGDACLNANRQECAAEQFAAAIDNQNLPDEASSLIGLADLWRQRGRTDQALELYEQAVVLQPSEANQLMLVSAYQEERRFEEAEALLRLLQTQRPLSVEVITMAADVNAAQAQYDEAIRLYGRALWIQELAGQESVETRLDLTQVLLDANRLDEAEREIDRLLVLQPDNALAYSLQGDLFSRLNEPAKSTLAYQKAFRLDPTQVRLFLALSNQFRQQGGQQDELLDLLQTAIRANPDEATLALAVGDQLQRRGDTNAAIDAYQAALDMFELYNLSNTLNPRTTDTSRAFAYTRLAGVSEDMGQMEPAMNYYSAAVAAAPDLAWSQVVYGDALRRRDDKSGAEAAYRRAIRNDPIFANAYIQLAELLEADGNMPEANLLRQEALQIAIAQTESGQTATTQLGLGKPYPLVEGPEDSFDSDAAEPIPPRNSEWEQEAVEQVIAQLAADGDRLLDANGGAGFLSLLARLSQNSGQEDDLINLYQQALDKGRNEGWYPVTMAQYYKGLGDLYLSQDHAVLAAEAYRNAITLDDWWPQPRLGLARALADMGQDEESLEQLQIAVNIAPGFVEAQISLAAAYDERGGDGEALSLYEETAASHPGNPRATLALARASQAQLAWETAEQAYRATIAMNPGNSDAYVELATLLIAQARYDEAESLLEKAQATNQENVNAYVQRGILEQRTGDSDRALAWFRQARQMATDNLSVTIVLSDLLQRYGNYSMGLTYVDEALKQQPQEVDLVVRLARLQRLLGLDTDAMTTLLNAARLNLTDSRLSAELGELYNDQGRPQAALAAYRQTVTQDPAEVAYYLRLAELWNGQAMFDLAEDLLLTGLTRVNQPAPLFAALADLYVQQGRPADAKAIIERGLAELGEETTLVIALGAYLESQSAQTENGGDSAAQWYNEVLARQPNNAAVYRALGDHYASRDRIDDALSNYRRAIELEPANGNHYVAAAAAYEIGNRIVDAEELYRQAISLEPTLADTYVGLAQLYAGQGRLDEEQAVYEQGLAAAPTSGTLYVAYAESMLNRGEPDRANDLLAIAEQVSPTAETFVARAAVESGLRDYDAAMRDLQAAVQKEPGNLVAMIALGDLYRDLGDTKKAQQWYAAASKLSPGIAAGRLRLARLTR